MSEELQEAIDRLKPIADAVVEAASDLNAVIQDAARHGLSVRVEVLGEPRSADDEVVPQVRVRIAKRIA